MILVRVSDTGQLAKLENWKSLCNQNDPQRRFLKRVPALKQLADAPKNTKKTCNFANILFHISSSSALESSERFPQMFLLGCPYYQPEKPEFHSPSILRVSKCLEKSFSRNPLTQNNRLRLLVSRNPRFRRTSLILSLRESSPCGALEAPNDSMNQENRPMISKFEWLACLSTADYAVSRLSVFLWIPWNPLEAVESRSRPCRVAVANVLGSTKVRRVNPSYGFPARLLVFLVIRKNEIHADLSVGFGGELR